MRCCLIIDVIIYREIYLNLFYDEIKRSFFSKQRSWQYCYMDATHGRWLSVWREKLHSNCTRMLRAILNKSWRQHPTKQQLYGHLPPISKTIQIRQARHAGHGGRSNCQLISHVLLWTPSHGRTRVGQPARIYLKQLCTDTGCSLNGQPRAMDDRDEWQERVREFRASGTPYCCWWFIINLF